MWIKSHDSVEKIVCVSAGNFGQAIAYAGKQKGLQVHVFSIKSANPFKMKAIERLGAHIHLLSDNYDFVRAEAESFAKKNGCYFIVDGKEEAITEGAGTIALELCKYPLDRLYIPVGDGALINGIGSWYKSNGAKTKIIGVCARGAPAMYESWRRGHVVSTESTKTIADGIAINTPIKEAYELLSNIVDEMVLVDDEKIIQAMKLFYEHEHIVTEPAGAISLAAAINCAKETKGKTVGIIISGSNIDPQYRDKWLQGKNI